MILITGATGIVGHYVAKSLVESGHKIRAIKRANSDVSRLAAWQDNIEWVEADVLDLPALEKAFAGIERVVHCAALVSFHKEDKAGMMDINVNGTANMVNLALAHNVKRFVHISSVAALGRKPGLKIIDETVNWEASSNNSNYSESKHMGELEVWRGQEEGLSTVIVNPSIVLGPGKWDSSSMQLFKYVKEERIFYPPGDMNYVDVRDVTQIITTLLFNDISEQRFILNAGMASYFDVFALISKNLNKPAPRIKVTYALLTFAYIFETIKTKILGTKSIITRESLRLSKMSFMFSNQKVIDALNFKFRTLEDSIGWTSDEIKKQNL